MGKSARAVKRWFTSPHGEGDRSIHQQLQGLRRLIETIEGKTVLDVGCAEGLIALELDKAGARAVHGIEIVSGHIAVAQAICAGGVCSFEQADANTWTPKDGFDVTLMLAILHKLKDPCAAAQRFAHNTRELCVVRLPPEFAPVIIDARSGNRPHNIQTALLSEGFQLVDVTRGAFNEWCGYFRRVA